MTDVCQTHWRVTTQGQAISRQTRADSLRRRSWHATKYNVRALPSLDTTCTANAENIAGCPTPRRTGNLSGYHNIGPLSCVLDLLSIALSRGSSSCGGLRSHPLCIGANGSFGDIIILSTVGPLSNTASACMKSTKSTAALSKHSTVAYISTPCITRTLVCFPKR
ncbi:hypothetical protein BV20DRAFT_471917 [Pilatotrama ljubarskyi]|nr:hypothetical protein BV20DRAFT_471917 [Pilatotrama ljubarskyi]